MEAEHHPVKAVAHASLARLEVNLEELEVEAREQDAQASGAILALAMGEAEWRKGEGRLKCTCNTQGIRVVREVGAAVMKERMKFGRGV